METANTVNQDFEIFKTAIYKWVKIFGLDYWNIAITRTPLDSEMGAETISDPDAKSVNFRFNSNFSKKLMISPENCAKHEAIHLLLADLVSLNYKRFLSERECLREEENLVQKLVAIIKEA